MPRKTAAIALIVILIASSFAHADHRSQKPDVGVLVKRVSDSEVVLDVTAADAGQNAGLVELRLFEDGRQIASHLCHRKDRCDFDLRVQRLGTREYFARAFDVSGNVVDSKKRTVQFVERQRPPVLVEIGEQRVKEGFELAFAVRALDEDPFTITAGRLPRGASFDGKVFRWTPDRTQSGIYIVNFEARDDDGRSGEAVRIIVENNPVQPKLRDTNPDNRKVVEMHEGDEKRFRVEVDSSEEMFFRWTMDRVRQRTGSNSFLYRPGHDDQGFHNVSVRIERGDFEKTVSWTVLVRDQNRPPEIRRVRDREVEVGDSLRFAVSAQDPDRDITDITVDRLPDGAEFRVTRGLRTVGIFTWTPEKPGIHRIQFTASDGQERRSTTVKIAVQRSDIPLSHRPELVIDTRDFVRETGRAGRISNIQVVTKRPEIRTEAVPETAPPKSGGAITKIETATGHAALGALEDFARIFGFGGVSKF